MLDAGRKTSVYLKFLSKTGRVYVLAAALIMVFLLFARDVYQMIAEQAVNPYIFSGDLINYSAGFVRRGLLGEIVMIMNGMCQPFISLLLMSSAAIIFILWLFTYRMTWLRIRVPYILAILLSPSLILMHRDIEIFRADSIVIALNIAAACILMNQLFRRDTLSGCPQKHSFARMFLTDIVLVMLLVSAALIHEISVFLLPTVLLIFFLYTKKSHRTMHFLVVINILFIIYAVMMKYFKFSDPKIIAESWYGILGDYNSPDVFRNSLRGMAAVVEKEYAMSFVNMALSRLKDLPLKIYIHMLMAIAVPFILLMFSGISVFHSASYRCRRIRVLLILSSLAPLSLAVIAVDYGRWFSMCAINLTACTMLMAHRAGRMRHHTEHHEKSCKIISAVKQLTAVAVMIFLLNYVLSWDGYFHKAPLTVFRQAEQAIGYLPDLGSRSKQLLTREILIKP